MVEEVEWWHDTEYGYLSQRGSWFVIWTCTQNTLTWTGIRCTCQYHITSGKTGWGSISFAKFPVEVGDIFILEVHFLCTFRGLCVVHLQNFGNNPKPEECLAVLVFCRPRAFASRAADLSRTVFIVVDTGLLPSFTPTLKYCPPVSQTLHSSHKVIMYASRPWRW